MINIQKKLQHPGFQKYFSNTFWLFLTQGVRLFAGLFVGLLLARYLGPQKYGIYNYVISIIAVVMSFTRFGTEDLIVKEILQSQANYGKHLSITFYLRLLLSFFSILCAFIYYKLAPQNNNEPLYIFICSFALIFQSFEVIDLFYRATVKVKFSSIFRIIQVSLSSFLKLYLIFKNAEVVLFFYVFILDSITYSLPLFSIYLKKEINFVTIRPNILEIKKLFKSAFPLMMATTSAILLNKVDQILIAKILGQEEAGYYIAASKLIEISSLIPTLIMLSLFTAAVNAKMISREVYIERFKKLATALTWFSIIVFLILYSLSGHIIPLLYSSSFEASIEILRNFSFHLIPLTFSIINIKWYISEGKNNIVMFKTLGATITNTLLCFYLIPKFQHNGAIISTITTYLLFFVFIDVFSKNTREAFYINFSFLNLKRLFI